MNIIDLTLPSQDFFVPTKKFLSFLKGIVGNKVIVECGCGNGLLSTKLMEMGCSVIPLDIYRRESNFPSIQLDATTFKFPSDSVAIIARPNRGTWIYDTIKNAIDQGISVIYIGLQKHLDDDIFSLDFPYEKIYDAAGESEEVVYKISNGNEKDEKGEKPMNNKRKFFLIKYTMGTKGNFLTSWYTDDGDKWRNMSGGWMPKKETHIILETQEANDFYDLDWKKTYFYRPDADSGWLSRTGEFIGCGYMEHDLIADLIIKKEVSALEQEGWVRIYSKEEWTCLTRLSAEQCNFLSTNGYKLSNYDQETMG